MSIILHGQILLPAAPLFEPDNLHLVIRVTCCLIKLVRFTAFKSKHHPLFSLFATHLDSKSSKACAKNLLFVRFASST